MTRRPSAAPTARLAARARAGDARARSRLHRRLHGQVHRFAFALVGDPALAGHLARGAIETALASAHPDRFVTAALADVRRQVAEQGIDRHGGRVDSFEEGVERAVLLLVDDDGLTPDDVAAILAVPADEVTRFLRRGRRSIGVAEDVSRCHGWALVRRLAELTPTEATAARSHLDLCRSCTEAYAAREASRARLRRIVPATGAAGTGIAAGVSALLTLGGSSGVGAAAGAAVVAGALAAPLAILPHLDHHPAATPGRGVVATAVTTGRGSAEGVTGSADAASAQPGAGGSARGTGAGTTERAPGTPTARPTPSDGGGPGPTGSPSASASGRPTLDPTGLPTHLPTTLPTRLPTRLPTTLPTALPTTLPPVLPTRLPPLPTVTITLSPLPTTLPPILPTASLPLPCLPIVDPHCP